MPDMDRISVTLPVLSTAFLPDAHSPFSGHSTGMDLAVILENIEYWLKIRGLKAEAASRAAGSPDAIRNIKRKLDGRIKGRGVTVETLAKLAATLGVTPAELTAKRAQVEVRQVTGLRDEILKKLEWLDRERARALEELDALDTDEKAKSKRSKQSRAKR